MNTDEVKTLIASRKWYHAFKILPGVITPGQSKWNPAPRLNELNASRDMKNSTALDVGAWDGPLTFEFEKRGADVVATDIQDPDVTTFNTAKSILKFKANYIRCSVYDLSNHVPEESIGYLGFFLVYYHLKHPIAAFEQISSILKPGGMLYFEGEILANYAECLDGTRNLDLDIDAMGKSETPIVLCCPGKFKRGSNWHVPNLACINSWLRVSGLELSEYTT